MRISVALSSLLLCLGPIAAAQVPQPFTIFTGPGAGNALFTLNGVNAFGPGSAGVLGSGPHCPAASRSFGDITLGPTTTHFHGVLNGAPDPDEINCGWGHAAPGDYLGLFTPGAAGGVIKTFVLPHVLEVAGTINTPFSFDTTIATTYAGGADSAPVGAAEVNLYLFDQTTGSPLQSGNGTPVAAPVTSAIGSGSIPRKHTVNLDAELTAKGGFAASPAVGFGIVVVRGDVDNVALQGFVTHSKSSALDLAVFGFAPVELVAAANSAPRGLGGASVPEAFLRIDNLRETPGSTSTLAGVSDTLLKAVYAAGLVDAAAPASVNIRFTLFNADGTPLAGTTGPLDPLDFTLDSDNRVFAMTVEEMLQSVGGLAGPVEGYAIAHVTGDIGNLALAGYHIQTNSGPNDLIHFDQTLAVTVPEPAAVLLLLAAVTLGLRRRRERIA